MKVRFRFAKLGRVRWTSHRDVARMWERALRRAALPVAYSGGFSPRPQLSFGLALPTGCESLAEYLDAAFDAEVEPGKLPGLLESHMPEGVSVTAAARLEVGAASLQEEVTSCTWIVDVPGVEMDEVARSVERAMAAESLPLHRERKGRRLLDDLRPSVLSLHTVADEPGVCRIEADLATRPRGVRPSELAEALGLELGPARRTHQWIERSGSRCEPLAVAASPVVLGCAS